MKMTTKTLWFHEGHNVELISVDAKVEEQAYVRVALFRCQPETIAINTVGAKRLNRENVDDDDDDDDEYGVSSSTNTSSIKYVVDIITNMQEKMQLDLLRTNEKPLLNVVLNCVKIYGDKILLGGNNGLLFVGTIGRTTGLSLETGKKVLYCVTCRASISSVPNTASECSIISNNSIRPLD